MQTLYNFLSGPIPGGIIILLFILLSLNISLYFFYKSSKLFSKKVYQNKLIKYNTVPVTVYIIIWFVFRPEPLPTGIIILPFQDNNKTDYVYCETLEQQLKNVLNKKYFIHSWCDLYQTAVRDSFIYTEYRIQLAKKIGIPIIISGTLRNEDHSMQISLDVYNRGEVTSLLIHAISYQDAIIKITDRIENEVNLLDKNIDSIMLMFDEQQMNDYVQIKMDYLNHQYEKAKKRIKDSNILYDILLAKIFLKQGIREYQNSHPTSNTGSTSHTQIIEKYLNSSFQQARNVLYVYVKESKDNAEINRILGKICLYEKNYELAEIFLKKSWVQDRYNARLYYDLSFLNRDRLKEIGFRNRIEVLEKAVYFNPGFKDAVYDLAYEYFYNGTAVPSDQYTVNSIKYLTNYLRFNPAEKDILSLLASIYVRIKETEKAIDIYNVLLKVEPDNAELDYNLGICYFHLQKYELARNYFLKAIDIDDHTDSYLYLASIYKLEGDYDKALYYFRERVRRKSGKDDEYARQAMRGIRLVLDKMAEQEANEGKDADQNKE